MVSLIALLPTAAGADEFDRLEGAVLADIAGNPVATAHEQLTTREIGSLPNVLPGVRSAPIVVVTDQGNLARLLTSSGVRKPPGEGGGEGAPILLLERFETFEAPKADTRLARGRELMLFDGFSFDLDTGQVVPEGQGGDIQFLAKGEAGPRLVALGKAKLYTLAKSPLPAVNPAARPSQGRAVLPGDFAGRYRLFANGQWSGTLALEVGDRGVVGGTFRSDQTGTSYKVTGQVAPESSHRIRFAITFPRSRQEFDGHIWTEGRGAIAGTTTLLEREFGFFALREGARYAPEGLDLAPPDAGLLPAGRREVVVQGDDHYGMGGKTLDAAELTAALEAAAKADPETWVLLRLSTDASFRDLTRALEAVHAARIFNVRAAPGEVSRAK